MQKLSLRHSLSQKLSPQQIQFIKLLQIQTMELESRIEEELEINPALEEGTEDQYDESDNFEEEEKYDEDKELDLEDYMRDDDISGYKMQGDGIDPNDEDKEIPVIASFSLNDSLIQQLGFLKLDERKEIIAKQLIGSIEPDGYIRRELEAIINDLAFSQFIEVDLDEVEEVLYKIQAFEPAGIAARNLQECLLIQLERRDKEDEHVQFAFVIIDELFEEFTKKHYDKIQKKLNITDEQLKASVQLITRLNPKPGSSNSSGKVIFLMPDFIITNEETGLHLTLNSRNAPDLKISRSYSEMMDTYSKSEKKDKKLKDALTFVKQKLDAAKWFIDAIKQRQQTLLKTMGAILKYQYEFFEDGDESKLKPMILKDIAEKIDMDISTVSRVANNKSVQTEFGIYPLKYFFSESLSTDSGEDVSSREVKSVLKGMIEAEDKRKPMSDDKLVQLLNGKGYNLARRTVAKYREQLNIPVARLRKEL